MCIFVLLLAKWWIALSHAAIICGSRCVLLSSRKTCITAQLQGCWQYFQKVGLLAIPISILPEKKYCQYQYQYNFFESIAIPIPITFVVLHNQYQYFQHSHKWNKWPLCYCRLLCATYNQSSAQIKYIFTATPVLVTV